MGVTPLYGLPYPETTDPPHGPNQVKALAEAVEGQLGSKFSRYTSTFTTAQTNNVWNAVPWSSTPAEGTGAGITLSGDGKTFTLTAAGLWTVMLSLAGDGTPTTGWIATIATSTAFTTKLAQQDSNKVAVQSSLSLSVQVRSTGAATVVMGTFPNGGAGALIIDGSQDPRLTFSWRPL